MNDLEHLYKMLGYGIFRAEAIENKIEGLKEDLRQTRLKNKKIQEKIKILENSVDIENNN